MKTIPHGWMIALGSAKHFHLYVSVSSNQRRIAHCCFPVVCDRIRQNFHFISTSLFVSFIKLRCGDYWKSIPFQGLGFSQAKTRWMFGVAGLWTFILWWFPEPTNFLYLSFFLLCGNERRHDEKFCRPKMKWVWINWRKWSSVELDLLHCALQFVLSQPIRCKAETNRDSVTCFSPALMAVFRFWVLIGSLRYFPFPWLVILIALALILRQSVGKCSVIEGFMALFDVRL